MLDPKQGTSPISEVATQDVHSKILGIDSIWVPLVVGGQGVAVAHLMDHIQHPTVGTQVALMAIMVLSMVFPLGRGIHEFFLRRRHRKEKPVGEAASA